MPADDIYAVAAEKYKPKGATCILFVAESAAACRPPAPFGVMMETGITEELWRKPRLPWGASHARNRAVARRSFTALSNSEKSGHGTVSRLPFSIKVLLESLLRNCDGTLVTEEDVTSLAHWNAKSPAAHEVPFKPARVILQDFTGVPAVVDLAAMRAAMKRLGGDATKINPLVPVDLVIDHSVQVDFFGNTTALERNAEIEFERNRERYEFLRWGQQAFQNFRVVPPATGIVHQVNLEFLAKVVLLQKTHGEAVLLPDTLVGNRLAHHDDQWAGSAGLGRGRHRSGSRHAGPALLFPDAESGGLPAARETE